MLRLAFDFIITWRESKHSAECLPIAYGELES